MHTKDIIARELAFFKLAKDGYKILLRDYECSVGVVDLIAKHEGDLVFISVNRPQKWRMKKTAEYYLKRYGIQHIKVRFDRVTVNLKSSEETEVIVAKGEEDGQAYVL